MSPSVTESPVVVAFLDIIKSAIHSPQAAAAEKLAVEAAAAAVVAEFPYLSVFVSPLVASVEALIASQVTPAS